MQRGLREIGREQIPGTVFDVVHEMCSSLVPGRRDGMKGDEMRPTLSSPLLYASLDANREARVATAVREFKRPSSGVAIIRFQLSKCQKHLF